jgi:hypothetical protein
MGADQRKWVRDGGTTGTFGMMLGIFLDADGHIAREAGGSR